MNNLKKTALLTLAPLTLASVLSPLATYASTEPQAVGVNGATTKMIAPDYIPASGNVTYSFDEKALKTSTETKLKGIYKVECSKTSILKSLGITVPSTYSVGMEKGDMDWNYDLRNCSLYGNPRNFNYSNQGTLKKADALSIANKFLKENVLTDSALYSNLGDPIVTMQNYGPVLYKDAAAVSEGAISDDVEVDETDVTEIEKEYSNYTVTYPFIIGGMKVYGVYGNQLGVTVEVSKNGITNVSVPLLKFKLIKKTSPLMSFDEIKNTILKGGNTPYYGNQGTAIDFKKIEKVLVVTDLYSNGKNDKLLTTGTAMISDLEQNNGSSAKYIQIISDYKVGNNSVY